MTATHSARARPDRPGRRPGGRLALRTLAAMLAVLAAVTVWAKLSRLAAGTGADGATALAFLHGVTRDWWEGAPVYAAHRSGMVHPPATWLLLGPAFGWTSLETARWLWAGVTVAALAALAGACTRAVRQGGPVVTACAALAVLSMPALADAIGIGTLIPAVLPLVVWAVLLARRPSRTWGTDLAAAGLFDLALVDPGLALPFAAAFVAAARRLRPVVLAVAGYLLLTATAARLHPDALATDLTLWIAHVERQAGHGYGNVQDWLHAAGWPQAFWPASAAMMAATYAFVWHRRDSDVWLLLGVSAIAGRLWMAPRIDADALLLVPLVALARAASRCGSGPAHRRVVVTLAAAGLVLWMPLQLHFPGSAIGPVPVGPRLVWLFDVSHLAAAVLMLVVLAGRAAACRASRAL